MTHQKKSSTAGTGSRTPRRDGKRAAVRNELLARENTVLELRAMGWSMDRIAAETGYADSSGVAKALRRALLRQASLSVEELKSMESHKLDQLEANLQELLRLPGVNVDSAVKVLAEIRKVLERRSRLHGLDAGAGGGQGGDGAGRENDWEAERGFDLIVEGDDVDPALIPWDHLVLNATPGAGALPPPTPSVIMEPSVMGPGPTRYILVTGGFEVGGLRFFVPEEHISQEFLDALTGYDDGDDGGDAA